MLIPSKPPGRDPPAGYGRGTEHCAWVGGTSVGDEGSHLETVKVFYPACSRTQQSSLADLRLGRIASQVRIVWSAEHIPLSWWSQY